jgi:hypothetical protein
MEALIVISGIIAVIFDIPLIWGILNDKVKQNFATFFLWCILDGIAFITIMLQGKNFWLPLGYSIGSFAVAATLIYKKQVVWTWIERTVVGLIVVCLFIWWRAGDQAATIASVVTLGISSIPQIIDTFKDPKTTPTFVYMMFSLAGILSFIGGENWNIEDKFYAAGAAILSITIMLLSMRKINSNPTNF